MVIGVVYKITCNKTDMVYYGSTTNYNKRIGEHTRMGKNQRGYHTARSYLIIEQGDYTFSILEHVEGDNLLERERFYIENNKCINRQCPLRTKDESYTCECGKVISSTSVRSRHLKSKEHKEYIDTGKQYVKPIRTYEEYKYDKINCDCGGKYTPAHKALHFKTKRHQDFITRTSS